MFAFWINYGFILHLHGQTTYSASFPSLSNLFSIRSLTNTHNSRPPDSTSPSSPPALHLHVPLQRIPPLARKCRPLRACHRRPLTRARPTAHTALHPRRALRHRRVTRARAPAHRRLSPPRPAARDVDDARQPQAGADLHRAHNLPADDGHQRHQPVRAADPREPEHQGDSHEPVRDEHLRHRQDDHLRRVPALRRRLARPPPLAAVDLDRPGHRHVLHQPVRARRPARHRPRGPARRVCGAGVRVPARGLLPVRLGPVCWIYVSEIPIARLRGLNVAIAAATQWLFHFVVARATPNMLATVGKGGYGYMIISPLFASVFDG